MFAAMIWLNGSDKDFLIFGPFPSFEHGAAFLDKKLNEYSDDARGDVFVIKSPN